MRVLTDPSSPNTYCVWLHRITVFVLLIYSELRLVKHMRRSQTKFNAKAIERRLTERQGFEPWVGCPTTLFESATFNHSATSPKIYYVNFWRSLAHLAKIKDFGGCGGLSFYTLSVNFLDPELLGKGSQIFNLSDLSSSRSSRSF